LQGFAPDAPGEREAYPAGYGGCEPWGVELNNPGGREGRRPRVRLVPVIADTAERYALIYAYLRQKGRPIPTNDLWIAASAMEHSAELLTADGHFLHVPQIITRSVRMTPAQNPPRT
jgi:hypothetical protein